MPLKYHPEPGTILICDYTGFREPEMVKRRPVILVSPRLKHQDDLATIVPLSTTAPGRVHDFHYELELEAPLPAPFDSPTMWVKADMLATVAFHRLDLVRDVRGADGKRKYLTQKIIGEQLRCVYRCVLSAIGLPNLTRHLCPPHVCMSLRCLRASGFQDLFGGGRTPGDTKLTCGSV